MCPPSRASSPPSPVSAVARTRARAFRARFPSPSRRARASRGRNRGSARVRGRPDAFERHTRARASVDVSRARDGRAHAFGRHRASSRSRTARRLARRASIASFARIDLSVDARQVVVSNAARVVAIVARARSSRIVAHARARARARARVVGHGDAASRAERVERGGGRVGHAGVAVGVRWWERKRGKGAKGRTVECVLHHGEEDDVYASAEEHVRDDGDGSGRLLSDGRGGFIGRRVATALKGRGDGVVGLDNVNDYYPSAR